MSKRLRRGSNLKSLSSNSGHLLGRAISDLKSASLSKMSSVEIPFSKFVLRFIEFLYTKGLVTRFYIFRKKKKMFIHVVLGYFRNSGFLDGVKLKSIPSRVVVLTYKNIFYTVLLTSQFWGGLAIFSTKYGILDAHSCLKFRTGGVFLCFVPYVS